MKTFNIISFSIVIVLAFFLEGCTPHSNTEVMVGTEQHILEILSTHRKYGKRRGVVVDFKDITANKEDSIRLRKSCNGWRDLKAGMKFQATVINYYDPKGNPQKYWIYEDLRSAFGCNNTGNDW